MPRPFQKKIRDPKWWLEQLAHAAVGGVVSGVFGTLSLAAPDHAGPIHLLGMLLGATAGALREVLQNMADDPATNDAADAAADAFFFTAGAFLASLVWVLA